MKFDYAIAAQARDDLEHKNGPAVLCANGRGLLDLKSNFAGSVLPAFDFGCIAAFRRRSD
ncbi:MULTISPECIES: hypothetical protein [Mesorhizobium]|uniref:hypothetical protein n=1 Tax=Mesorhizobium TaxID=68287 RepID=UPI0010A954CA|nr:MULTISPECIES: hypothetical protein [Mesorhizobium]QND64411.1 hypothetical protein HB777_11150 [Mesorhizobium loti]